MYSCCISQGDHLYAALIDAERCKEETKGEEDEKLFSANEIL